jgi:hypothetical protein
VVSISPPLTEPTLAVLDDKVVTVTVTPCSVVSLAFGDFFDCSLLSPVLDDEAEKIDDEDMSDELELAIELDVHSSFDLFNE